MLRVNEGGWDRVVRVVAGAVLLYLGWGGVVTGLFGTLFKFGGFLPLLTGVVGVCPAYSLFRCSTKRPA